MRITNPLNRALISKLQIGICKCVHSFFFLFPQYESTNKCLPLPTLTLFEIFFKTYFLLFQIYLKHTCNFSWTPGVLYFLSVCLLFYTYRNWLCSLFHSFQQDFLKFWYLESSKLYFGARLSEITSLSLSFSVFLSLYFNL